LKQEQFFALISNGHTTKEFPLHSDFYDEKTGEALQPYDERGQKENYAFCECGDSLETIRIWREDKKYGKIIDHYEYYCIGCDETYVLIKKMKVKK
jgi:hypothetical protein